MTLAAQAASVISNAATVLLAARLVTPQNAAGAVMFALMIVTFGINLNRACVGDVLLIMIGKDASRNDEYTQDAVKWTATLSLFYVCVLFILWSLAPPSLGLNLLIWLLPTLPLVMIQDLARYVSFATLRPSDALLLDLRWVLIQGLLLVLLMSLGVQSAIALLVAWGVGGAVSGGGWLLANRRNVLVGSVRRWFSSSRELTGPLTATSLVGQSYVQFTAGVVTSMLGPSQFAQLRLMQTLIQSPASNIGMALNGLLVPQASRSYAAGNLPSLRRHTALLASLFLTVAPAGLTVLIWAADPIVRRTLPGYESSTVLVVPIALQACATLAQIPFNAALRGMRQGKALLAQALTMAAIGAAGATAGARIDGVSGAAWGMFAGSAAGVCASVILYRRHIAASRSYLDSAA